MSDPTTSSTLRFRPERDLPALIRLYESNYVRLVQLLPELGRIQGCRVSRVSGALDLYVTVLERHKYTTALNLTYRFDNGDVVALEPNARVYLYHDVRAAELVSHSRRRRSLTALPWRRGRMPELDRRWVLNRFLLKWVRFCLHQGHLFLDYSAGHAPDVERLVRMPDPEPPSEEGPR
ncbi:MAG: DUF1249 domain-containing protein [Ectothiorhodospiraceae bacterium]|nr:DUF1249 domain-containing protein [Ectothiorhodospiraceae bacterium]